MVDESPPENHNDIRLNLLVKEANKILREIWRARYRQHRHGDNGTGTTEKWEDRPEFGTKLVTTKDLGQKVYQRVGKIQKEMLEKGDCKLWDVPLFAKLLTSIKFNIPDPQEKDRIKEENKTIEKIPPIRHKGAHLGDRCLGDEEFQKIFQSLVDPLVELGGCHEKFEQIRTASEYAGIVFEMPSVWFNMSDPIESFWGREEFLKDLHDHIQNQNGGRDQVEKASCSLTVLSQIKIISGLAGIGKTQVARKYVQNYKKFYKNIIWINASTKNSLHHSFIELAKDRNVKILTKNYNSESEKPIEQILTEIYDKIRRHKTLIIFDNAEKLGENKKINLDSIPDGHIKPFLPPATPPSLKTPFILVISRNGTDWGTIGSKNVVFVPLFSDQEAIHFVLNQLDQFLDHNELSMNQEDAAKLNQCLGGLPLALQQAVAYIKNENENNFFEEFTIKNYLEIYQEQTTNRMQLLNFPPDDSDSNLTVYATLSMSLDKIQKLENGAMTMKIVEILAFFQPDQIPSEILLIPGYFDEEIDENDRKKGEIVQSLKVLKKYGLIQISKGNNYISIHRAVQDVVMEKLKEKNKIPQLIQKMLKPSQNFINSTPNFFADPDCPSILENLLSLTQKQNFIQSTVIINELLELKLDLALKFKNIGYHNRALQILQEIETQQLKMEAQHHHHRRPETIWKTQLGIASVLENQSKFEESMTILKNVFEAQILKLGALHHTDPCRDILGVQLAMANLLKNQCQYDMAMVIYEQLEEDWQQLCRRQLGNRNYIVSLLEVNHNKAVVLEMTGKFEKAKEIYKKVFELRCIYLGPLHPDTMTTQGHMGRVLDNQKMYDEAMKVYEKCYENQKTVLGPNHPDTLKTRNCVARVLGNLNRGEEAMTIFWQVLHKRQEILGTDHYDSLTSQCSMAWVLVNQKKFEEAYQIYEQVVEIRKNILPPHHPDLLGSQHNMARVLASLRRHEESYQLYEQVYEIRRRVLGEEHPDSLKTFWNMADVLTNQKRWEEALAIYTKILTVRRRIFKEEGHPELVATLKSIAFVERRMRMDN